MQGARCDAVRALLAVGNAAERRLWKSEITIIYWGLLSAYSSRERHLLVVHQERGQGVRRTRGEPRNDDQRSPRF